MSETFPNEGAGSPVPPVDQAGYGDQQPSSPTPDTGYTPPGTTQVPEAGPWSGPSQSEWEATQNLIAGMASYLQQMPEEMWQQGPEYEEQGDEEEYGWQDEQQQPGGVDPVEQYLGDA